MVLCLRVIFSKFFSLMTRDAFNEIIHRYNRNFFAMAFRFLRNQHEAEDIVQEVFMKMWLMGDRLDDYSDVGALGLTMTKNNCIDMIRKRKHIDTEWNGNDSADSYLSPSPYEKMVKDENQGILNRIIDELPPLYRDLIQLKEINGLSYEEISRQSGIKINTLRVTLSRARKIIKAKYLEYVDGRA